MQHLTATQRACRAHYGKHRISIAEAKAEVLNCARKAAKGSADDMAKRLTASLEVETGCSIAALAEIANGWDWKPHA